MGFVIFEMVDFSVMVFGLLAVLVSSLFLVFLSHNFLACKRLLIIYVHLS